MVLEGDFSFQLMRSSIIYERAILTEYFDYDASRKPYIYRDIGFKNIEFYWDEKGGKKSAKLLQIHHQTANFFLQKN